MNVADALIPKTYASGDAIVRQGDPADGMFFVEGGICEVFVEDSGTRKKVYFTKFSKLKSIALLSHTKGEKLLQVLQFWKS